MHLRLPLDDLRYTDGTRDATTTAAATTTATAIPALLDRSVHEVATSEDLVPLMLLLLACVTTNEDLRRLHSSTSAVPSPLTKQAMVDTMVTARVTTAP